MALVESVGVVWCDPVIDLVTLDSSWQQQVPHETTNCTHLTASRLPNEIILSSIFLFCLNEPTDVSGTLKAKSLYSRRPVAVSRVHTF